jgi:hypothetical protein
MLGFNGGLMGVRRTPTTGAAPGLWFQNEQSVAKRANIWPRTDDEYFANVSLLLHMDGSNGSTTFTDNSSNGFTVTANGNAQISTAQSKWGGASGYFDGAGDFLTVPVNSAFELGTGDFDVELWARFDSVSSTLVLLSLGDGANGAGPVTCGWALLWTGGNLYWYRYDHPTEVSHTFAWSPSINTWYHVRVTRSGTSLRALIDNVQIGSTITTSQSYNKINSDNLHIGRWIDGGGTNYMPGYIDDLRITKGVARPDVLPSGPFPNY